jgi:ribosome-binding protein aMBF1 (putative translation factor)
MCRERRRVDQLVDGTGQLPATVSGRIISGMQKTGRDITSRVSLKMRAGYTIVQAARTIRNLSVADLAARSSVRIERIVAFEAGEAMPNPAEATMIGRVTGVPPCWFRDKQFPIELTKEAGD